jgi:predicted RNA-binding protein YlqC (UPF0109 family)
MKDVVEYLVRYLVDRPEAVRVQVRRGKEGTVYLVEVAPDKGRLIGKGGRVIESLRTVVRAYAKRKVGVEVR